MLTNLPLYRTQIDEMAQGNHNLIARTRKPG